MISKNKNQRTKEIWAITCAEFDRKGAVLESCKVLVTDIVLDRKLVGFGLEESDGGRYLAIEDMMRQHAAWLLPPPQKKRSLGKVDFWIWQMPPAFGGGHGASISIELRGNLPLFGLVLNL